MAQLDTSIPMSVRSFNLGELADSYMVGKKFSEDIKDQRLKRAAATQEMGFGAARESRAAAGETRAVAGEKREQVKHDEELKTLAQTRKEKRRAFLNSMLGEEAEILSGLAPEKRKDYYSKHLVPSLKDDGFDVSDMDDYDDGLIDSWRQLAISPDQRSTERMNSVKANAKANEVNPQLKVDATGNYVPVNPNTGLNAVTGQSVKAAPQQFLTQGEGGFYTVSVPRGGAATATPVPTPGQGGQLGAPLKTIPDSVKESVRTNEAQKRAVATIMSAVVGNPNSPTSPGKEMVRQYAPFGRAIVDAWDPQGQQARELIGQLSSLKIKDVSGAAVTASEFPRLTQWIPQVGDTKQQVVSKLTNFQRELDAINSEMGQQYSQGQGFRPDPILNAPARQGGKPWERFKK